jgi:hypothetical protein
MIKIKETYPFLRKPSQQGVIGWRQFLRTWRRKGLETMRMRWRSIRKREVEAPSFPAHHQWSRMNKPAITSTNSHRPQCFRQNPKRNIRPILPTKPSTTNPQLLQSGTSSKSLCSTWSIIFPFPIGPPGWITYYFNCGKISH